MLGNSSAFRQWYCRNHWKYADCLAGAPLCHSKIALLTGIATGITISLVLSKLFAFRSRSWRRTAYEAARLAVYATGCR